MAQASSHRTPRRGRVFPQQQLSPSEKAQRKAKNEAFHKRCRAVFERV